MFGYINVNGEQLSEENNLPVVLLWSVQKFKRILRQKGTGASKLRYDISGRSADRIV